MEGLDKYGNSLRPQAWPGLQNHATEVGLWLVEDREPVRLCKRGRIVLLS
jgi:hypothetical protein